MLSNIVVILFFLPPLFAFPNPFPPCKEDYSQLNLPSGVFGDSVALDPHGEGPYVDVSDGRILKYNGKDFIDFAYTSPNRTKEECDDVSVTNIALGQKCGRPSGFTFDPVTGDLYIIDAYKGGLFKVGPKGGQATLLASSAGGVAFNFLAGIDFDPIRRIVYFTDASQGYTYRDVVEGKCLCFFMQYSSGRLLEYNTITRQVKVLLEGLPNPSCPSVSTSGAYVLFTSTTGQQIFKYWVGPGPAKPEVLLDWLPGYPIKIRRAPGIDTFWVAVNEVIQEEPHVVHPFGYKFNSNFKGKILLKKNFTDRFPNAQVNVVQEYATLLGGNKLYVSSRIAPYVGIYTGPP